MQPTISDEPTMVKLAEADVRRRFPTVDQRRIEAAVRSSVHRWCERARVQTFVPIFAARDARAVLDRELSREFIRPTASTEPGRPFNVLSAEWDPR
jgi:hypothetical protein